MTPYPAQIFVLSQPDARWLFADTDPKRFATEGEPTRMAVYRLEGYRNVTLSTTITVENVE
jgi:hypothetical protein